jgi:hypothetical protein
MCAILPLGRVRSVMMRSPQSPRPLLEFAVLREKHVEIRQDLLPERIRAR